MACRTIKTLLIACALLPLASSCYYDNVEDLYGNVNACDTSAVTFSQDIAAIISTNCVSCHSDNNPTAGLSLEGHANVSSSALGGGLMNRIQRPSGDPLLMPPSGPISDCDQSKLREWINQGALDN